MTLVAAVLAAGGGTRFTGGTHKLLTPFRGRCLVSWSIEQALLAGFDETIVVTGGTALEQVIPAGVVVVPNPAWASGQASSLKRAVAHARSQGHEALIVGLADQPMIPASAWRAVASASTPIVVATYGGRRANPVKLSAAVWDLLPNEGDVGARALMARRVDLVGEVACVGDPADIDTLEDLDRWS